MESYSNIFVFAAAESRLAADILVLRLKLAGIAPDLISALYPPDFRPNCAGSLLKGTIRRTVSSGEPILVSGALRFVLGDAHDSPVPLAASLRVLGLGASQSLSLEETLLSDGIVLCVQAEHDRDLGVIFRILREHAARSVHVTETASSRAVPASRWAGVAEGLSAIRLAHSLNPAT